MANLQTLTMEKDKVFKLYDIIYSWYDNARTKTLMEINYLEFINSNIETNCEILDLGCGTGEPIAKYFIEKGYKVTGVDAAKNMLNLCKSRFPKETWILADIRNFKLNKKFSAIIAWDSFFHLPHSDQRNMFQIFKQHSNKNTYLLFTSGPKAGEVIGKMDGHDFYHASLSEREYRKLLKEHNFDIITYNKNDINCGNHTVWLAQYTANS